jgi:ABC-2 type transport system permease protein
MRYLWKLSAQIKKREGIMSNKVFAVISREFITRVRTKGFIIGTLLMPLMFVLFIGGVFIFAIFFQPSTKTYDVVDQSGVVYNEFVSLLDDSLDSGQPKFVFNKIELRDGNLDSTLAFLQGLVNSKKIDGYLIFPQDILQSKTVQYAARNVSNFEEQRDISIALSKIVTNHKLAETGVSPDSIRKIFNNNRVELVSHQVTEEGSTEKSGASSFVLTYILVYMMFLMVMIYGQMVMRSVIEEKSQRISETIVSAVRPMELLVGKLIGICMLGITQLVIVGVIFLVVALYGEMIFSSFGVTSMDLLSVVNQIHFSLSIFAFMILFFIFGFIFYASIFAAVGAMVNTEEEGQQFQMPIIILLIFSFFIMFTVAQNPDTVKAYWISLVPFFTPVVMFARISVSDPVLPDGALLSIPVMIISTFLLLWVIAKIYRVGILMYGKKPSLKEAVKWIKYK